MASPADDSEHLISCPICFETYKKPKCLPCLHTFCENCLCTYITSCFKSKVEDSPLGFNCPVCRKFVSPPNQHEQAPEKWAAQFPSNHLMNSLIDQQQMFKTEKLCEVCTRIDEEQKASSWCFDCSEAMCTVCIRKHVAMKSSQHHHMVSLDELTSDQHVPMPAADIFCDKHKGKKLEIYCHDHHAVCCLTCMTVNHRKCDKVTTLEEAADDIKGKAKEGKFIERLESLRQQMVTIADDRNDNIKELETQKKQIEDSITTHRAEVNKYFDDIESKMRTELTGMHKENITHLQEQRDQFENRAKILEQHHKLMQTGMDRISDLQICLELNKIQKQLESEEFSLKKELDQVSRVGYQYSVSATKENLKTCIVAFGQVETKKTCTGAFGKVKTKYEKTSNDQAKRPLFKTTFKVSGYISDGSFLPDGRFVLAIRGNSNIQIFDCNGTLLSCFPLWFNIFGFTFVQGTSCIASDYCGCDVRFIDPINRKETMKRRVNGLKARGFGVLRNNIIVASVDNIKVLDQNGNFCKDLLKPPVGLNGEICSVCPTDDDSILYTDRKLNQLHCIDMNGTTRFSYSDKTMVCPTHVTTDESGNIYLTGRLSHNIHVIDRDGKFQRLFLSEADGIHRPYFLSFNRDFSKCIVCCDMDDKYSANGGSYIKIFDITKD